MGWKSIMICTLLTAVFFILSSLMKTSQLSMEKFSPFECGFDPNHENRSSFSLRFFMLTVIFLIFDTEITLLMVLPLSKENNMTTNEIFSHFSLFFLLLGGLLFEWKQGALNWLWFYI